MDEETRDLIESETNVEVLQAWVKYSFSLNKQMEDRVHRLEQIVAEKEKQKAELLTGFKDELICVKKLIFGRKSEKRPKEDGTELDLEEKRLLLQSETLLPPPKETQTKVLPMEEVLHEMTELELNGGFGSIRPGNSVRFRPIISVHSAHLIRLDGARLMPLM